MTATRGAAKTGTFGIPQAAMAPTAGAESSSPFRARSAPRGKS